LAYAERYVQNIEPAWEREHLDFGSRMHELLAGWYSSQQVGGALKNSRLEDEAQAMFAAYQAFYPREDFEVLDVERTLKVQIPDTTHTYVFKMDALVRLPSGLLSVLDHKTESRNSHSNRPEAWASRPQVGLYQWAAEQIHGEKFGPVTINILRRGTEGGKFGPEFRRDEPTRTPQQMAANVRWLVKTADLIEECERTGYWPDNRNGCMQGPYRCDYYDLHNDWGGASRDLVQLKYRPAKEYLDV
jgi:hypothetical protein